LDEEKFLKLFFSSKIAGKKYIWQKASLEGVNLICFFAKKQIKFTPSKKISLIYYLPDAMFAQNIINSIKP